MAGEKQPWRGRQEVVPFIFLPFIPSRLQPCVLMSSIPRDKLNQSGTNLGSHTRGPVTPQSATTFELMKLWETSRSGINCTHFPWIFACLFYFIKGSNQLSLNKAAVPLPLPKPTPVTHSFCICITFNSSCHCLTLLYVCICGLPLA